VGAAEYFNRAGTRNCLIKGTLEYLDGVGIPKMRNRGCARIFDSNRYAEMEGALEYFNRVGTQKLWD
jgi:hypothetical protein